MGNVRFLPFCPSQARFIALVLQESFNLCCRSVRRARNGTSHLFRDRATEILPSRFSRTGTRIAFPNRHYIAPHT
jgi:hypothetical protein